jgi:hypothetical protein
VIASPRVDLRKMAEQDQPCQVEVVELAGSEESGQDEGSDGDAEKFHLSPQSVFKKMLQVATHMSQKDRQQQKILLSLAMQAIEEVEEDSRSHVKRKKKRQEATPGKNATKEETQGRPLGPLSPASSRVGKRWSPEEITLVKKLRAKNIRWVDIAKYHLPGRTGRQISSRYNLLLKRNKDLEDVEEIFEESELDGAQELGSDIGWSNQKVHGPWLTYSASAHNGCPG